MKKFTIINVTPKNINIETIEKKNRTLNFLTIADTEAMVEKLNLIGANMIFIDKEFEEKEVNKITKLATLLHPEVNITTFDFNNLGNYQSEVQQRWRENFIKKAFKFNIEDNPNLNNPFLNLDKTNIFNK